MHVQLEELLDQFWVVLVSPDQELGKLLEIANNSILISICFKLIQLSAKR